LGAAAKLNPGLGANTPVVARARERARKSKRFGSLKAWNGRIEDIDQLQKKLAFKFIVAESHRGMTPA
jgi:hypothetical protein